MNYLNNQFFPQRLLASYSMEINLYDYEWSVVDLPVELGYIYNKPVMMLMKPTVSSNSVQPYTVLRNFDDKKVQHVSNLKSLNSLAMDINSRKVSNEATNCVNSSQKHSDGNIDYNSGLYEDNSSDEDVQKLLKLYPNYIQSVPNGKGTKRFKKTIFCTHSNCTKFFTKTWNFIDHARMHCGERPFKWNLWNLRFTQKGNMKQHMKRHLDT